MTVHEEESAAPISNTGLVVRLALMLSISVAAGWWGNLLGLDGQQCIATAVFLAIILGTLFFWAFRLAIAFLGIAVLIFTQSLKIPQFVESAELPVILFLVGMMIVVGALRDLGFFTWVIQTIIAMPRMTGRRFLLTISLASALLACAVDEVTSIIFITALVFQVCDRLKLSPAPYVIICVLCTNVGSAGTMLGNPVGIYIGTQAGLAFQDFMVWSFPIMVLALAGTALTALLYYRKEVALFDERLRDRIARDLSLAPVVKVPYVRGLALLTVTVLFIASHHPLEAALGLEKNSILLVAPLVCAGVIMIVKRERARHYVEHEVDWWTLVFFLLLFAIAGTLEHSGVTAYVAQGFAGTFGRSVAVLVPVVMASSAIGSAFVDNVIFVAAFSPIIRELGREVSAMPLWWALLYGACFGGNITMIGSTANIVALGMLEKHSHANVRFFQWFLVGMLSAVVGCLIAWVCLMILYPFMPDL